jgi:hypothetical protein
MWLAGRLSNARSAMLRIALGCSRVATLYPELCIALLFAKARLGL